MITITAFGKWLASRPLKSVATRFDVSARAFKDFTWGPSDSLVQVVANTKDSLQSSLVLGRVRVHGVPLSRIGVEVKHQGLTGVVFP